MRAIILAAGSGTRLGEKGKNVPKCLLKIAEESILERHLRCLREIGCVDVSVIVGKQGSCWNEGNIRKVSVLTKNIVINPKDVDFKRPYSLFCGLRRMDKADDTIIIDGDIVYSEGLISWFVGNAKKTSVLTMFIEPRYLGKGSKVLVDKRNRVLSMGHNVDSCLLYSGICIVGQDDFERFKAHLRNGEYWDQNFSRVVSDWCKGKTVYNVSFNNNLSILEREKEIWKEAFKEWKGEKYRLININTIADYENAKVIFS